MRDAVNFTRTHTYTTHAHTHTRHVHARIDVEPGHGKAKFSVDAAAAQSGVDRWSGRSVEFEWPEGHNPFAQWMANLPEIQVGARGV